MPPMPRSSSQSKATPHTSKKSTQDIDEYKPPLLSVSTSQLKFLHFAAPYYKQAVDKEEGPEFIDKYFEDVYHRFHPVPHHEYFCMEAAEHAKSILKKMIAKRLWWLRLFISGVETKMEWRHFVALGAAPDDAWRTEIIRLREALKNRTGTPTLPSVANTAQSEVEGREAT